MTRFLSLFLLILFPLLVVPGVLAAQSAADISEEVEDDKGFVTRFLEEKLSGAGRKIVISGFQGALSSRATFESISISDAEGEWLVLRNGAIQWQRSALLLARVEIQELSAAEIDVLRAPASEDDGGQGLEAKEFEFALPELPVSLRIAKIAAERVRIAEDLIGQKAVFSVNGQMELAGGEGAADLTIERQDGQRGSFVLDADFSNSTKILNLDLSLDEAKGGFLSTMLDLPDNPAVAAHIVGKGAISDFSADIRLATNDQPRITGQVLVKEAPGPGNMPGIGFSLNIGGDVAVLVKESNRAFFGQQSQLVARGWRGQDGRMSVPELSLKTEALTVTGHAEINEHSAPTNVRLYIALGRDAGADTVPVRLPFAPENQVEAGHLDLAYDASKGDNWALDAQILKVTRADMAIEELRMRGDGKVRLDGSRMSGLDGNIEMIVKDIAMTDPGMAQAVGTDLQGQTRFDWTPGNAVDLSGLIITGADYGVAANLLADGLGSGVTISGEISAQYDALDRLSKLAGRPVSGRADAYLTGYYTLLNGAFDAEAEVNGNDIKVDQDQVDGLLRGRSVIRLSAARDDEGTEIRDFSVDAQRVLLRASGPLNSRSSNVRAMLSVPSLADIDPEMTGSLQADAFLTGPKKRRRITLNGQLADLHTGVQDLDSALEGKTTLAIEVQEESGTFNLEKLRLANPQMRVDGQGAFAPGKMDATVDFDIPDIGNLYHEFAGNLAGQARLRDAAGSRLIEVKAKGDDLRLGQQSVQGAKPGVTVFDLHATQGADGNISVDRFLLKNNQVDAHAQGVIGTEKTDIQGAVKVQSMATFGRGWRGALDLTGRFADQADGSRGLKIDGSGQDLALGQAQLDGAFKGKSDLLVAATERDGVFTIDQAYIDSPRVKANARGRVGNGQTDVSGDVRAASLAFLGRGFGGALQATGRVVDDGATRQITAQGTGTGLTVGDARADAVLRGTTRFDLVADQKGETVSVSRLNVENPQLRLTADGDAAGVLNVDARLSDLGLVLPAFPGPTTVTGTVRQTDRDFVMDLTTEAPGNTRATIAGRVARNGGDSDLRIRGNGNAALANPFLRVRSVEGPMVFDMRMAGKPGIEALSGSLTLPNGRMSDPKLGVRMDNVDLRADFDHGRINIDGRGDVAAGGVIRVSGPVDLRGQRDMDVQIMVDDVVLRDPNLYETTANGTVRISGPQALGAVISGRIKLGSTEIRIPSASASAKDIPDIQHLGDRPPVRATRAKAGLAPFPSQASRDAGMAGPAATPPAHPMQLDLTIEAPNRVFVRGRGIDAELGGGLQLSGTTQQMVPIGHLGLVRGRVDLLGKRFMLTEGLVELQGSMIPVLRLVAETQQDGIVTRIIIDGEAQDPDIKFESDPNLPEEEVLSHLLFGRGLDKISALQAAQLANAVAVLAGKGGIGIVGKLREQTGLDDLDLTTDDQGNVGLRAGKYISEKVYTDVSVDNGGKTKLNINLDISDELTARGSVDSRGDSSIGLFYERDY